MMYIDDNRDGNPKKKTLEHLLVIINNLRKPDCCENYRQYMRN